MHKSQFLNRRAAGVKLACKLNNVIGQDSIILALPGGGMSVAKEVGRLLKAPLYSVCVRKLGIPGHDQLSMGAVAPRGAVLLDRTVIRKLGITESVVQRVVEKETLELQRCEQTCQDCYEAAPIAGRTAVIIDDSITDNINNILAAVEFTRKQQPERLLIAAPVIAAAAVKRLQDICERLFHLYITEEPGRVDYWYEG
jgi:putative phosphoribosyl transferase